MWLDDQEVDLYFNRLIRELPDIKLVPKTTNLNPNTKFGKILIYLSQNIPVNIE
jgi:hypothetical protein